MTDSVQSPPFPDLGVTSAGLYQQLKALRAWIVEATTHIPDAVPGGHVPVPIPAPPPAAYAGVSVADQYKQLTFMRRLRAQWDHVVRAYEDCWDGKAAATCRVVLVQQAVICFNSAFVHTEHRDTRANAVVAAMTAAFERLRASVTEAEDPNPEG